MRNYHVDAGSVTARAHRIVLRRSGERVTGRRFVKEQADSTQNRSGLDFLRPN
jgi:hypothetical protein